MDILFGEGKFFCIPGWSQSHCIVENDLELLVLLGAEIYTLQAYTTTPSFCDAGDRTQSLMDAAQVLCPLSYIPSSCIVVSEVNVFSYN